MVSKRRSVRNQSQKLQKQHETIKSKLSKLVERQVQDSHRYSNAGAVETGGEKQRLQPVKMLSSPSVVESLAMETFGPPASITNNFCSSADNSQENNVCITITGMEKLVDAY